METTLKLHSVSEGKSCSKGKDRDRKQGKGFLGNALRRKRETQEEEEVGGVGLAPADVAAVVTGVGLLGAWPEQLHWAPALKAHPSPPEGLRAQFRPHCHHLEILHF